MISVDVEVNYFACIRLILEAKVDKDLTGEVPRIKNRIYKKCAWNLLMISK